MKLRIGMNGAGFEYILGDDDLNCHGMIYGPTGMGKSKLMTLMNVQMAEQGQPFWKIDMDKEGAEETRDALIESPRVSPEMKKKMIFLRPAPNMTCRIDPYELPVGPEYPHLLHRTVKWQGRVIGRKQGVSDYKEQPRRERWLGNTLYFVGTKVNGKHLGLDRALDVFEAGTPAWDRMLAKIEPHLPIEVARDWKHYRWMSPRDRFIYTESTQNWFLQFLSPLVKETLGGKGTPVDFCKIVREGWIVIADFSETPYFSKEQGEVFAAMVISSLLDAAYFTE